ncbi:MAG: ATP-binding protein [Candidatus Bipolaricaulis sp.]|nr:ATP-binding protein [Candidatus Bipolaricaulis sp.]
MREVLFLSGKGGTGKTSLAGAFAVLMDGKVLADCDVDAANLHLLLAPRLVDKGDYEGSKAAQVNPDRCAGCSRCREVCRFDAVSAEFRIDPFLCEGCGACVTVCPADAIDLAPRVSGRWFTAATHFGPLAGAELHPGEETSGKLVSLVKQKARTLAEDAQLERIVLDGSPGIGCPVIASASGVSAAILVTEPSLSGLHDLERILGVVRHFGIPAYLVVNKADLSVELAERLETFAAGHDLPLLGRIPYDEAVLRCLADGRSAVSESRSPAGEAMRAVYQRFLELESGFETASHPTRGEE